MYWTENDTHEEGRDVVRWSLFCGGGGTRGVGGDIGVVDVDYTAVSVWLRELSRSNSGAETSYG